LHLGGLMLEKRQAYVDAVRHGIELDGSAGPDRVALWLWYRHLRRLLQGETFSASEELLSSLCPSDSS
jgi:hypothetical protein